MQRADIGLIGIAVMGQNLVLNMADHGFCVAVFNRTVSKVAEFIEGPARGKSILGAHDLKEFVSLLKRPRRILFMVKAGSAVDALIEQLLPLLEQGDILIDGGNSHFLDTQRRYQFLQEKGFLFIGAGISGGEEGARKGPSIMPGGDVAAWPHVKPIFQAIAARSEDGSVCCEWVGDGGAGHYVKMVHNGIEYGDMQLICEAYHLLRFGVQCSPFELHQIFLNWNRTFLRSYLIEITSTILQKKDGEGNLVLDTILDVAGQKGTGKWTAVDALERGVPLTLIAEAVFARYLSSLKEERIEASRLYPSPASSPSPNKEQCIEHVSRGLYAAKIMSYTQGFMLMRTASEELGWKLDFGAIALIWRGGCIIRSQFLEKIKQAYARNPHLTSLLLDPFFVQEISHNLPAWRAVVAQGVLLGIALPCTSSALAFFDGYRTQNLPANLLQAQRDYFGAHLYERVDKPRNQFFHTDWLH